MKDNLLRNSNRYLKRQKAKGWKRHSIMADDELWQQILLTKCNYIGVSISRYMKHTTDEGEAD